MKQKFTYLTDISLQGFSGKEKATREKKNALQKVCESYEGANSRFSSSKNLVAKIFYDIQLSGFVFRNRKKIKVVIHRLTFGLVTLRLLKILNIINIEDLHADQAEENKILRKGIKRYFYQLLIITLKILKPKPDGYILNHPYLIEVIPKNKPFLVSYNGYPKEMILLNSINSIKQKKIKNEKIQILFVGSGAIWHGLEELKETWNKISLSNFELHIVGEIKKIDSRNIIYHGVKYTKQLEKLMLQTDAFILPYNDVRISPGSPLKLYEYLTYRKPILTFDCPGYSDEASKYGTCFHGNLFDKYELEKTLKQLENNLLIDQSDKVKDLSGMSWENRVKKWETWISENFY